MRNACIEASRSHARDSVLASGQRGCRNRLPSGGLRHPARSVKLRSGAWPAITLHATKALFRGRFYRKADFTTCSKSQSVFTRCRAPKSRVENLIIFVPRMLLRFLRFSEFSSSFVILTKCFPCSSIERLYQRYSGVTKLRFLSLFSLLLWLERANLLSWHARSLYLRSYCVSSRRAPHENFRAEPNDFVIKVVSQSWTPLAAIHHANQRMLDAASAVAS